MDLELQASLDAVPSVSLDRAAEAAAEPFANVPPALRAGLEARGFEELTAVQHAVLAAEVEGRDLQISSQTGSGKTVALGFVLAPHLMGPHEGSGPQALIIVPTRELATQVGEELGWLLADLSGVRVGSVTGGSPLYRDRQLLARGPRVLIGTPGRLLDHVSSGTLDLSGVHSLVLDEADQMLDMGFREELEGILDRTPASRRTHLVSATFPDGIQRLAARYQEDPLAIEGTRLGEANGDIEHQAHVVHARDRYAALVNLLLQAGDERTLVFVKLRAETLELSERLEADGFAALPLSGELAQSQRERTLAAFRAGRASVLVATDVAARGLDVPDVTTVIHTSLPLDAQVYTHRSGRTGRAGKRGRSVLMAPPNRRRTVERLLAEAGVALRWLPVPAAAEVRAELAARSRAALASELEARLAEGPADAHLAHAEELLEGRDAAPVVAALLARLEPARRVEPQELQSPQRHEAHEARQAGRTRSIRATGASSARSERPRRDSEARAATGARGDFPRAERPRRERQGWSPRTGQARPGGAGGTGEAVRFFVNWGLNQGATPGRILAALCRRGQVTGADIGSIAIHPNASTFDVRAEVVERFEDLAGRRDVRDPQVRIRRDRPLATSGGGRGR